MISGPSGDSGYQEELRHIVYRSGETTATEVRARNKTTNDQIDQASIEHVLQVGPNKPLGYAIVSDPKRLRDYTVESLKRELEARGLRTELMPSIYIPEQIILVAYDAGALQKLLDTHKEVLQKAGWPMTAREFALKVNAGDEEKVDPYTELFTLIADAFADYTNSGRIENVIGPYNPGSHFADQGAPNEKS